MKKNDIIFLVIVIVLFLLILGIYFYRKNKGTATGGGLFRANKNNIDGTWQGDDPARTTVTISNGVVLNHPLNSRAPITFNSDGSIDITLDVPHRGIIINNGKTISWDNGGVWNKQ